MNDVKVDLQKLARSKARIASLLDERDQYEAIATRRTTSYAGEATGPHQPTGLEGITSIILDLEEDTDAEIRRMAVITTEIKDTIRRLDSDKQRDLLTWRYVNEYTWEEIADKMGYEVRQVYRIHGDALKAYASARKMS